MNIKEYAMAALAIALGAAAVLIAVAAVAPVAYKVFRAVSLLLGV